VCVPTAPLRSEKRHDRALLIVGEAPGKREDEKTLPFVGKAGRMLRDVYIGFFKLEEKADVYLSNAVRCRPPQNDTPNKTQLKSCQGFLLADIRRLQREYEEVVVLAVGGPAVTSSLSITLKKSFGRQGDFSNFPALICGTKREEDDRFANLGALILETSKVQRKFLEMVGDIAGSDEYPYPEPVRVFTTYHPAYVLREPSNGLAVKSHLQMLVDYLDGTLKIDEPSEDIAVAPLPPKYPISVLSLDIETYGIIKGFKPHKSQTKQFFHPKKSEYYDGIPKDKMVVTVGLSWRGPVETEHEVSTVASGAFHELRNAVFVMSKVTHRRRLWAWFEKIKKDPRFRFLLGQNISFDLMYLRYCYPECKPWLDHPLPIWDLIVSNYLHNELRPEKSLKNLAPLYRITKYEGEFRQYDGPEDPLLWKYNCQDTAATLRLEEKLASEIEDIYGKGSEKLSPFCRQWYSDLLWLVIWMQETGVAMDMPHLRELHESYLGRLDWIKEFAQREWDIPVRGKGSEKAKRAVMDEAFEEARKSTPFEEEISNLDLNRTKAKGLISFDVENRNALLEVLPRSCDAAKKLRVLGRYQDTSSILDRYTYPLLVGRGKKHDNPDSRIVGGIAYPRVYPVPSEWEDGKAGGTKQARLAVQSPSTPTFPPRVKSRVTGRFPGGWLVWFDYSQIELRVAALLSNDSAMMEEYSGKPDLHGKTAQLLFGPEIVNHPQFKKVHRQAGKTFNFRALYRGGAEKAQETLMKDYGISMSLARIGEVDKAFWDRHWGLRRWQDSLVDFVRKHGYYELPLIGQSRLYLGGKRAQAKALNELVNQPVQTCAADIMLSAQFHLWAEFKRRGMQAVAATNIYDAAAIECPRFEIHEVHQCIEAVLPNPPYYAALCDRLGRSLPLEFELKEIKL
jgi:uracil-DNA glycosylase family 4